MIEQQNQGRLNSERCAPRKTNMEPENHPFEKENIFQTFMFGFHVKFWGCKNGWITTLTTSLHGTSWCVFCPPICSRNIESLDPPMEGLQPLGVRVLKIASFEGEIGFLA